MCVFCRNRTLTQDRFNSSTLNKQQTEQQRNNLVYKFRRINDWRFHPKRFQFLFLFSKSRTSRQEYCLITYWFMKQNSHIDAKEKYMKLM